MIDTNDSSTVPTSRAPRRSTKPSVATPKRGGLAKGKKRKGVKVDRVFSNAKTNPYDEKEWDLRTAEITDDGGNVIFKQKTAYEIASCLVGSEMCIRDRCYHNL